MKLYKVINKENKIYDQFKLQDDANNVSKWCKDNGLILNSEKCSTITFARKEVEQPFDYYINSTTLAKVNSIKDLGIIFDSKLNFQEHIDKIYCKSSKKCTLLLEILRILKILSVSEHST